MNRIRSKRNFKSLQLDVTAQPPIPQEPDPVPMRPPPMANKSVVAAAGGAKKRPPPMNLKPKAPIEQQPSTAGEIGSAMGGMMTTGGASILTVTSGPTSAPASGTISANSKRMTYHTTLSNKLASLDMSAEVKYDLRDEDLKDLHELGQGNGGSVKKVEHVPTHTIMAKKVAFFLSSPCVCVFAQHGSFCW
jgi:mitogen-activated protein kinase kinase